MAEAKPVVVQGQVRSESQEVQAMDKSTSVKCGEVRLADQPANQTIQRETKAIEQQVSVEVGKEKLGQQQPPTAAVPIAAAKEENTTEVMQLSDEEGADAAEVQGSDKETEQFSSTALGFTESDAPAKLIVLPPSLRVFRVVRSYLMLSRFPETTARDPLGQACAL